MGKEVKSLTVHLARDNAAELHLALHREDEGGMLESCRGHQPAERPVTRADGSQHALRWRAVRK